MAKLNDLIVTGDAKILGKLHANADTATSASNIFDSGDNGLLTINRSATPLSNPTYLAGWNGNELRAVNRSDLHANTANSAAWLTSAGANVANTRDTANHPYSHAVLAGGWASNDAGYGSTYGTTLDISGYSTWYHRLAFHTGGEIDYWIGINTDTLTKKGRLLTSANYSSYALPLTGGTITGTLVLSNTSDVAPDKDNGPALIIGGTMSSGHIEIDNNEIMAKSNATTPTDLYLNADSGKVYIGAGGLSVGSGGISTSGALSATKLSLTHAGTFAATSNYANALISMGSRNQTEVSSRHYFPWLGGQDGVVSKGYINTVALGLFHGAPSDAGLYIGCSWDGNNSDKFFYFTRDGRFESPKIKVGSYTNDSYALTTDSFICKSWIRTTDATGWYNETYGGGWYMTDTSYVRSYNSKGVVIGNNLYIGTTAGGGTGLSLYSTTAPTTYGIHMSTTGNYGKHGDVQSDWATYFNMNAVGQRGWIYRAGSTNVASVSCNGIGTFSSVGNNNMYYAYAKNGEFTGSATHTGYLTITLPVGFTSTMLKFKVSIFNYVTNTSVDYIISGYNYGGDPNGWHQVTAICLGKRNSTLYNLPVQFGVNGSKVAIQIGTDKTSWSYPNITISDITLGHTRTYANWGGDWTISFTTTPITSITQTVTDTYIGNLSGTNNYIAKFSNSGKDITNSNITDDGSTVTIGTKLVIKGNGSSFNEGIRILPASNKWSNIFFSANTSTEGTHDGGWLIGRRGAVGSAYNGVTPAEGDFTIEEESNNGVNLTIHKNSGGATLRGRLRVDSEIQTSSANGFRLSYGDYGSFIRNDGSDTYFLLTAEKDNYGTWNALRPFSFNNKTGKVSMGNGVSIANGLTVTGGENLTGDLVVAGSIQTKLNSSSISTSNADGSHRIGLYSSTNRGVYDFTLSRWLIYTAVADNTTRIPSALYVDADATVKTLTITDTEGHSHIKFSRTSSYNYLHVPGDSGTIALCANATLAAANCALVAAKTGIYPGAANTFSLGTSSNYWKDAHIKNLTMYGNITYSNSTYTDLEVIKFINGNNDGTGIVIGGGGLAVFGSGESASNLVSNLSLTSKGNEEATYITSDGSIDFYTNCQDISAKKLAMSLASTGKINVPGGVEMGSGTALTFTATAASLSASTPMSITYGKIASYGTLTINANTDNSGTEYVLLTAGKGLSNTLADGLAIGTSTLQWQGSNVTTNTTVTIDVSGQNVSTYYPVVINLPYRGLCHIKLAVQLNSGTVPSWSTHTAGFTSNIDVAIIASGWGTVSSNRYIKLQDDYNFASVKPAYFVGQLSNSSLAVFYVRGGGKYHFICDWQGASVSVKTAETDYNGQKVAPTTSTPAWVNGAKTMVETNISGSATTLRDKTNGTETYLDYGAAGITNPSWYAAWSGYNLRAISPLEVRKGISALGATNDGSYYGMTTPDGTASAWIRTTSNGIIPYAAKSAGSGTCYLGTSSWYFGYAYIDNIYGTSFSGNSATATTAYGVYDYAATTSIIKIGYSGAQISGSNFSYLAGYGTDSSGNRVIKDVSASTVRDHLSVPKRDGTDASGTWGINISGNAATATRATYLGSSVMGNSTTPIYLTTGGLPTLCTGYGSAITNITRSGTTFTATRVDGTTFTFTQRDNNTTYTFTNKAATLAWSTTTTIATVGGTDITVTMPANPDTDTNYYHTRVYSSGLKISTGTGVYDMYVPTATASQSGVMSTSTQTIAGAKTFSTSVTSPTFTATSDARLKENLRPLNHMNILTLPTYHFDFIDGAKNKIGCLAQDLQKICPELVHEGTDGYLSIEENKIVYLLLEKMKEMEKEINELKEKCYG